MPFKNPEKQKEYMRIYRREHGATYMRDFRKRKKKEDAKKAIDLTVKLTQLIDSHARTRRQWSEMLNIIHVMVFTVSRADLTDKEKIAQISKIPISDNLAQYLRQRPEEVTA